jgi:hypothetical protein
VLQQIKAYDDAGLRYHFELYPAEDHMVYATQDGFSSAIDALGGTPERVTNPTTVDFRWFPNLARADFGIGPTGAYWIRDLAARSSAPGTLAHVVATSGAIPAQPYTVTKQPGADVPGDPTPALVVDNVWTPLAGAEPLAKPQLDLQLTDVRALAVDMARARLQRGVVTVVTDGPTALRLFHLRPGTLVKVGATAYRVDRAGSVTVPLRAGKTVLGIY